MFLDMHAHVYNYPFPTSYNKEQDKFNLMFPTGDELIKMHDTLGIHKAVILPQLEKWMHEIAEHILKEYGLLEN